MSHRTLDASAQPSEQVRAVYADRLRTFAAIAAVDWANEPLSDVGRVVAGLARDFNEFYDPQHRATTNAVEAWLDRYSQAVHAAA